MSKIRASIWSSILVALLILGGLCSLVPIKNAESQVATSTYYDYKLIALNTIRDKIVSSYQSKTTTYGIKSFVMTAKNSTGTAQNYGYQYSFTKTGEISVGAGVKVKAIELELGYKGSYSKTETYSASVTVPARKTYSVYVQPKTEKSKYYSTIQEQWLYTDFVWRDVGNPYNSYSYFTAVGPRIIIQ